MKTVVLIGTLDSKGPEYAYLRNLFEKDGFNVIVIDASVNGEPQDISLSKNDINATTLFKKGNHDINQVRKMNRKDALDIACKCAEKIVKELHDNNRLHGIMAFGGAGGTLLGTRAMRALPFGVPKVMATTLSGSTSMAEYVQGSDITVIPSITDNGLNPVLEKRLKAATAGLVPLVEDYNAPLSPYLTPKKSQKVIGLTKFGVTTKCVEKVEELLRAQNYKCISFHATVDGRMNFETLIRDKEIDAVCDITTVNLSNNVGKGIHSVEDCLEAAIEKNIPQIISVGALDMINFGKRNTLPPEFSNRIIYQHDDNVTLVRTTKEECEQIGKMMAEKLNKAKRPIKLLFPSQGLSAYDQEGHESKFCDPIARKALLDSLKKHLTNNLIELVEIDCHINDSKFAQAIAAEMLKLMPATTVSPPLTNVSARKTMGTPLNMSDGSNNSSSSYPSGSHSSYNNSSNDFFGSSMSMFPMFPEPAEVTNKLLNPNIQSPNPLKPNSVSSPEFGKSSNKESKIIRRSVTLDSYS